MKPSKSAMMVGALALHASVSAIPTAHAEMPGSYQTSWIGNSYPDAQRWVPQDIDHIVDTADGTVYSNVHWEEGGGNDTAFIDGEYLAFLEEANVLPPFQGVVAC
jgi:hypothetical protein